MPGGLHDLDEDDDGHKDEDEAHDDRDHTRQKTSGLDTSAATLVGLSGLSALFGRHSLAATLALEASYPHLRSAVARHVHDLQHPRPTGRDDYVDPSKHFTFTSLGASFDRYQASEWFEGFCLAACVSIILKQHDLSGLLLATSMYPYLDIILPKLQHPLDTVLLYLHRTLPSIPQDPSTGSSSLMMHVSSISKEQCSLWAQACLFASCLFTIFRFYSLSVSLLAAALYPYLDAIIPRTFRTVNKIGRFIHTHLPDIPEEAILAFSRTVSEALDSVLSSLSPKRVDRQRRKELGERFKYDVISSSLLSTSLSGPPSSHGRDWHIRRKEDGTSSPISISINVDTLLNESITTPTIFAQHSIELAIALTAAGFFALSFSQKLLAFILLAAGLYTYIDLDPLEEAPDGLALTLHDLNALISASNQWDSTVQEALAHIEHQDRQLSYNSPGSPQSPSSTLRVALNTALHTTRTQCEKVRPLLAALTSSAELGPLTEMYAPPSPNMGGPSTPAGMFALMQDGERRVRTISLPDPPVNKRATWNGSYAALALAGSPTRTRSRDSRYGEVGMARSRSMKRRSEMPVMNANLPWLAMAASAPVSPNAQPGLDGVQEEAAAKEENEDDREERDLLSPPHSPGYFGADAMALRKRRRQAGMSMLGLGPNISLGLDRQAPSTSSSGATTPQRHSAGPQSLLGLTPSMMGASRLTALPTARHPLAVSALRNGLQAALSARRYACAHLLALRFPGTPLDDGEGEIVDPSADDGEYWADVRSVVGLLNSTFGDASEHLAKALDRAERQRAADEVPSRRVSDNTDKDKKERRTSVVPDVWTTGGRGGEEGFAPMPSRIARFAVHVEAIQTALDDARDHLEGTVAALRAAEDDEDAAESTLPPQEAPALKAYENLRKELGYALRECERGRERLLDVIASRNGKEQEDSEGEHEHEHHDMPPLTQDVGSDRSSGDLGLLFTPEVSLLEAGPMLRTAEDEDDDDAQAALLRATSALGLPKPGIEQVFEGVSGQGVGFSRARSKMSREERIAMAKAVRESGVRDEEVGERKGAWGPDGHGVVVQELKDVIWKVGERKRRMVEDQQEMLQSR